MSFTSQRHNIRFGIDAVTVNCYALVKFVRYGRSYSSHRLQARLAAPPQSSTNTLTHSLDLTFPTRKLSAREEETY
jgi:hypothetical protein